MAEHEYTNIQPTPPPSSLKSALVQLQLEDLLVGLLPSLYSYSWVSRDVINFIGVIYKLRESHQIGSKDV